MGRVNNSSNNFTLTRHMGTSKNTVRAAQHRKNSALDIDELEGTADGPDEFFYTDERLRSLSRMGDPLEPLKALIQERFGIGMQDRLVGKYLKRWGFTPQRPIKRALEQDPQKVGEWLKSTYPELLTRARAEGGTILWGDETAVKEDANWLRGFAPRGKTPVLTTPTRWRKLSMISAISARGEIAFRIVEGAINTERFIEFLEALIEEAPKKIFLIVDNLRVHHARKVKQWLHGKEKKIELAVLPPYAPESNPDAYLNRDFKTALRSGLVSRSTSDLLEKAMAFMRRIAAMPEHVKAYFRHPAAAYAAQGI